MLKKNSLIKNQKGFTVAELSVAIVIMIILIGVITTIFMNIYISFMESKRYSVAMMNITQIAEEIDKLQFEEVTEENLLNLTNQNGYEIQTIVEANEENTAKTVNITINYNVGNNTKSVELKKTKTRNYYVIPNAPNVQDGMVPVEYIEEGNGGYWVIASGNSTSWYNYYINEWANVMLLDGIELESGKKVTEDNKNELVGEKIVVPGSMFVWIPRYAYKITDKNIEIEFLYGNTDNCLIITQPNGENEESIEKTGDIAQKEGYKVHPSFENGKNTNYANGEWDEDIEGFWVAKYVAGFQDSTITYNSNEEIYPTSENVFYSDQSYTSYNDININNALGQNLSSTSFVTQKMSYPVFKPLTYVYNLISTGDSYTISQEVAKASRFYGLDSNKIDSHMMKNSEWGAVAYLTYSKYGRNGVQVTSNSKNLNNKNGKNIYAVTGYSGEVANGVDASSTNNMSGVFDLKGCVWEFVAGYIEDGDASLSNYGQPYTSDTISTKYFTVYPYDTNNNTSINNWRLLKNNNQRYGDAMTEIAEETNNLINTWDEGDFEYPYAQKPFIIRGGRYNYNRCTIFTAYSANGESSYSGGFRIVLINK